MSLSSALSNALSGLRASSVSADVIGSNIANALNENYSSRSVILERSRTGADGGVRVQVIRRESDPVVNVDWRKSNGQTRQIDIQMQSAQRIAGAFGDPTKAGSVQSLMTQVESALVSASLRPDLDQRLTDTAYAIGDLVEKINQVSNVIQEERETADRQIESTVVRVNELLDALKKNNIRVSTANEQSHSYPSFLDQRDELLNELSEYKEIRTYPRDYNTIAIYSAGGASLLETNQSELEFSATPGISAQTLVEDGNLNVISSGGEDLPAHRFSGGSLEALFHIRDNAGVDALAEIDAFAYDLTERFNDLSNDPTRTAGDLGILTDNNLVVDPANLAGLSERLKINAAIDPRENGTPSLLRDGLMAASPGPAGNASLLNGLAESLGSQRVLSNGQFAGSVFSVESLGANAGTFFAGQYLRSESQLVSAQAEKDALDIRRLDTSVDSDAELQKLMLIEQAYGANARVIQTVDQLMDTLLELV